MDVSAHEVTRYKYIFDEILRMTDDGFIVIDTNGIVTEINEQYCDFLGRTREEVVGNPITNVIKNSKMIDVVRKGYSDELAIHKYAPGDTKENDNNLVLVSRSCVFDAEGKVAAGVAQVRFRLQALESAKRLMSQYTELNFYREEYNNTCRNRYNFENIVGRSAQFAESKRAGVKAAKTHFPVLLTGETGTGKEVFARAIHNSSPRADKPMVSINCAAIPADLLESELFGYEEGAFTGAKKGGKQGKFQMANGGTVFLDEIGDMPLHMQAKILRTLQEGEVEPVGGTGPHPVDVRVISATRKNLSEMIENGEFREDLYYRLNVINIEMVPLRQRKGDVVMLASYFLAHLNKQYNKSILLSREAERSLVNYRWPGNIRELDNVIKGAYATCDGISIEIIDLPARLAGLGGGDGQGEPGAKSLAEIMDIYEREVIKSALHEAGGNCQQASEELGIHRSALYKKMAKLNICRRKEKIYE